MPLDLGRLSRALLLPFPTDAWKMTPHVIHRRQAWVTCALTGRSQHFLYLMNLYNNAEEMRGFSVNARPCIRHTLREAYAFLLKGLEKESQNMMGNASFHILNRRNPMSSARHGLYLIDP